MPTTVGKGAVPVGEVSVLAVVSSHRDYQGLPTGFFLPELAYPYHHLTRRGARVDVASPDGGEPLISPLSDPRNPRGMEHGDLIGLGFLSWEPAMDTLSATIPLRDVDPGRYAAAWVVGGVGPVFDLADDEGLRRGLASLWGAGKPVAAICHGTIALAGLQIDGVPVISGQPVTGFSKEEDQAIERAVPFDVRLPRYVEDELRGCGALYRSAGPGRPMVVHGSGGRLLTGQNQQSADEFGRALAELATP